MAEKNILLAESNEFECEKRPGTPVLDSGNNSSSSSSTHCDPKDLAMVR